MSGADIAAEVAAALGEAAVAVGDGERATLTRPAPAPQNPWDSPSGSPENFTVWAIAESYRQDQIDGTLILAEDRRVMIEAGTVVPKPDDKLTIGADEYTIVAVEPETPAGVPLYFVCQCRR